MNINKLLMLCLALGVCTYSNDAEALRTPKNVKHSSSKPQKKKADAKVANAAVSAPAGNQAAPAVTTPAATPAAAGNQAAPGLYPPTPIQ